MKKILAVIFMLAIIPTASFAAGIDFQFGVTAFYNQLITDNDTGSVDNYEYNDVVYDDFTYGFDARLNLGILQISGLALITPGGYEEVDDGWGYSYTYWPTTIEIFASIGLKFDIAFLSFGFAVGPNFIMKIWPDEYVEWHKDYYGENPNDSYDAGAHFKLFADLNLGRWTVSLTYLMMLNVDEFSQVSGSDVANALDVMEGYLGLSLLYKF